MTRETRVEVKVGGARGRQERQEDDQSHDMLKVHGGAAGGRSHGGSWVQGLGRIRETTD